MGEPICFFVQFKDLCDKTKNPNFSLSPRAILKNDKIPKTFLSPPTSNEKESEKVD